MYHLVDLQERMYRGQYRGACSCEDFQFRINAKGSPIPLSDCIHLDLVKQCVANLYPELLAKVSDEHYHAVQKHLAELAATKTAQSQKKASSHLDKGFSGSSKGKA